jgi:hypothetical protein
MLQMALLMSDSEYTAWWLSKQSEPCSLCHTTMPLMTSHCAKHKICGECKSHEEVCNISACSICPAPPIELDLRCECGSQSIQLTQVCSCGRVPKLLRHFTRKGRLTNYILDDELLKHKQDLIDTDCAIKCPCGTFLERTSACNHVTHCRNSICAHCGAVGFPWENGLVEHMRETGCLQWPTPESSRTFAARRRQIVDAIVSVGNTTCMHP